MSIIAGLTAFFAIEAQKVEIAYGLPKLLSEDHPTNLAYEEFKARFGGEEAVYILGIDRDPLYDLKLFNGWRQMGEDLSAIEGVDTVISVANSIFEIKKNTESKKFEIKPLVDHAPSTPMALDSLRQKVQRLPFYRDLLYSSESDANLMLVKIDSAVFLSKRREAMVDQVLTRVGKFEEEYNIGIRYTGFPFIRTVMMNLVRSELSMFVLLALGVTVCMLLFFFRSIYPVLASLVVVLVGVVWSSGIMGVLGYQINILTGLIPPLIIVIGVPNCIFLVNKYHAEFRAHGNKMKSLSRVIQKIGNATFMTNATTATGFATFIFTQSDVMQQFGVVASINILAVFLLAILIIPILFTVLPAPKERHTKHLDKVWVKGVVEQLVYLVTEQRKWVYWTTGGLVIVAAIGLSLIETTGNLVDDFPSDHQVLKDLKWIEHEFHGVMPFEVIIDAGKPGKATTSKTLRKIDDLQDLLQEYDEFSKPLSVAEGIKFLKQGFYNGAERKYSLISRQEQTFFKPYFDNMKGNQNLLRPFVDSTRQYARVSAQMADVGTKEMDRLLAELRPRMDSIFSPEDYTLMVSGSSIVFLEGTNYLVENLFISLFIAIVIVALLMAILFSSFRMIVISIFTNLVPLLFTGAIMGYFGIPIKPSTILVFSIAFGISVDDTIHYLAKYRMELKNYNWNIGQSVVGALRETGVSMIYTSIILFFGFGVFASSQFGGTQALGILVSLTLLVAMVANLVLLPSLLLTLERLATTRAFKEPLLEILDEEEDIDHGALEIQKSEEV